MTDARIRGTVPIVAGNEAGDGRSLPRGIRVLCLRLRPPGLSPAARSSPGGASTAARASRGCGKSWKMLRLARVRRPERGRGRKTAAYLVDRFRRLKLEPLFDGRITSRPSPARSPAPSIGRNVGAHAPRLRPVAARPMGDRGGPFRPPGRPPRHALPGRRRQCLGRRHDARGGPCVVQAPTPPKRSIMFIGFDLEEVGLFGSRYFVAHPPVPLERVVAVHHGRHDRPRLGRRLRDPRLRHGHRARPGPAPLDRRGGARPAADRSACSARTSWSSIAATTARSAAAASRSSSSRPAKTPAITRPTTPPRRSIIPS